MRKEVQKFDNEVVKNMYDFAKLSFPYWSKAYQLDSCQAWIFEDDTFYYLKSYNTLIAVVDKNSGYCYDFLRLVYGYTATSSKHISKFFNRYGSCTRYTYRHI